MKFFFEPFKYVLQKLSINTYVYYVCTEVFKGQEISKAKYLCSNSSKKRTKYLHKFDQATRSEFFRSFFERIENKNVC